MTRHFLEKVKAGKTGVGHQQGTGRRQNGAVNITNPLLDQFTRKDLKDLPGVADVLYGIAVADEEEQMPLSTHRLFIIFCCSQY